MDLGSAIQKHAEWKFKLRNAVFAKETLDAAAISKDNNCEFGKWLHGEAKTLYGKSDIYARCVAAHAAFHLEAGKVAVAVNARKQDEVERLLTAGSGFSETSKKIGICIVELRHEISA